jgi:RNA polymerase sigma-70 factor (ECF subfamily)
MAEGPALGLHLIADLKSSGELDSYHLLWSTEADLLRRLGRDEEAAGCYRRALELAPTEPERRFLARRLEQLRLALRAT